MSNTVTYPNQTPDAIRTGDQVTDHLGRTFYAYSDAVQDQMGQWNVQTADGKYYAYEMIDLVTLTYVEDDEFAWQ